MKRRKDNKGRVLKDGESQRKDGRYQYRWNDRGGKRRTIYADDLKELRTKESDALKAEMLTVNYDSGNITVLDLAKQYQRMRTNAIRRKTAYNNSLYIKRLSKNELGGMKIKDVTVFDAKNWALKLHEEQGKSYNTIDREKAFIHGAFAMAMEDKKIAVNPFSFALSKVITNDQKHRKPLTDEEYCSILEYMRGSTLYRKYIDIVIVLHETGIRAGEICGLTLDDIDLQNGRISINKQLVGSNANGVYIEKTKTKAGDRVIPMTPKARQSFQNLISSRRVLLKEPAIDGVSGFLLINRNGKPRPPWDLDSIFKHIRGGYERATGKTSPLITPHVLRHTFCTNMIRMGMNVKEVQYLMGHSKCNITLDVYAHANINDIERKFDLM